MEDAWDKFWKKRNRPLTPKIKMIFQSNFSVMYSFILMHWWGHTWYEVPESLEIGCGRATISDHLRNIGFETFTMDQLIRDENKHFFIQGDVLENEWPLQESFDLIVSYGLLEHFTYRHQMQIINNCDKYLVPGGMQIHYVVPSKLTNIFEDRDVYRDKCKELAEKFNCTWVYPIIGDRWITNKWLAKGFIFYKVNNASISVSNSKIVQH